MMARKPMPWFRCYVEMCSDPKIRRLRPEHRWLWISVLAMARQSPVPGVLMVSETVPATITDIADFAGLESRSCRKGVAHLLELCLLVAQGESMRVAAWESRQYDSDVSTPRVKAHRERSRNADETLQRRSRNGHGNGPESETESETERSSSSVGTREPHPDRDDDDDDRLRLIHNHLERWARVQGKTNPTGYALTVCGNHRDELADVDLDDLNRVMEQRWPLTRQPLDQGRSLNLGEGEIFLPGTGIISTGEPEHRLSDIAQAALRQLDA